jgi:hypothetical protein
MIYAFVKNGGVLQASPGVGRTCNLHLPDAAVNEAQSVRVVPALFSHLLGPYLSCSFSFLAFVFPQLFFFSLSLRRHCAKV